MRISIIAAMSENRVIGNNNTLPDWEIPGDLKRFKRLTKDKVVLMGRRTFESLGKPLADRWNIVVSSTMDEQQRGIWVVRSLDEGIRKAKFLNPGGEEIMIIGGGMLYELGIPISDRIYLTVLEESWAGDTFFPKFNTDEWKLVEHEQHQKHSFLVYDRVCLKQPVEYTALTGTTMKNTNGSYEELGREVGALVDVKNKAYGSAFDDAGAFLKLLYPDGIQINQYVDALALVRIFDKMKRIATDRDALGESPYRDISGYGLLGLRRVEKLKETLHTAISLMETRYGVDANGSPVTEE